MTIEEEFFKAFGIEKRNYYHCSMNSNCDFNEFDCSECCHFEIEKFDYPEITDRKYLELYCIQKIYLDRYIYSTCVKNLKEELLQVLINYKEIKEAFTQTDKEFSEFTNKIKALFEE